MNAIVKELIEQIGLNQRQAEGIIGLLLAQGRGLLSSQDLQKLLQLLPDANELLAKAPQASAQKSGGLMGKLMGSLGGAKGLALAEVLKGLQELGIPQNKIQQIQDVVFEAAETHYPEAKDLIVQAIKGSNWS